ncbi:hypothetical protein KAT24_02265 [Candidatus Pacearchaeota archaeon]|nr:hypothetical protein [Candidatus Pacearchaeota archaeon]
MIMEGIIFEIKDKSGRKVHLSKERWKHITMKHTNITDKLEDIKETLVDPLLIIPQRFNDSMKNYYLYYKHKKYYLLVSVKYLNGKGYVATAFMTRKIVRR